jgi:hypothetical protein
VGTACSNIMNANPDRYILVQIHLADAYTYTWGTQRQTFYSVTGLPTTVQDGILRRVGAYPAATYQSDFTSRRNVATNVLLELNPHHTSGPNWSVDITASLEESATAPRTMRLHMIQVIDQYPTPNTHWRNCMMQGILPASAQVITLQPGESHTITYPLTLSGGSWTPIANRPEVKIIAWAQGTGVFPSGSEVFQATQVNWRQMLPTDLNANGTVDLTDLAVLLSNFGMTADALPEEGDTDGDQDVDLQDLSLLLADFGT